jgi:hypothetical protein
MSRSYQKVHKNLLIITDIAAAVTLNLLMREWGYRVRPNSRWRLPAKQRKQRVKMDEVELWKEGVMPAEFRMVWSVILRCWF